MQSYEDVLDTHYCLPFTCRVYWLLNPSVYYDLPATPYLERE
jgi:hypothetical protein